jgi:hypothetical protein
MRKQPLVLATNDWGCASIHGSSSETGPDRFITSSVKRIDHSLTIWDEGFVVHHPQFDGLVFACRRMSRSAGKQWTGSVTSSTASC